MDNLTARFKHCDLSRLDIATRVDQAINDGFRQDEILGVLNQLALGLSASKIVQRVVDAQNLSNLAAKMRELELADYRLASEQVLSQQLQKGRSEQVLQKLAHTLRLNIDFQSKYPKKLELPCELFLSERLYTPNMLRDLRLLCELLWYKNYHNLEFDLEAELLNEAISPAVINEFIRTSQTEKITTGHGSDEALALLRKTKNPILYLRSFEDDQKQPNLLDKAKIKLGMGTSEKTIVKQLQAHGEFIALGVPGESGQRKAESARLYLPHDSWQNVVRHLLVRANKVILRVSDTPGILWELNESLKLVEPHRLIIVTPQASEVKNQSYLKESIIQAIKRIHGNELSKNHWPMVLAFQADKFPKHISSYKHLHMALSHSDAEQLNKFLI